MYPPFLDLLRSHTYQVLTTLAIPSLLTDTPVLSPFLRKRLRNVQRLLALSEVTPAFVSTLGGALQSPRHSLPLLRFGSAEISVEALSLQRQTQLSQENVTIGVSFL